jgi:hypothetical protein
MRRRIFLTLLILSFSANLLSAQDRFLRGKVVRVERGVKIPEVKVTVIIEETEASDATNSVGIFTIPLATRLTVGKTITLAVDKPGWVIQYPLDGKTPIPGEGEMLEIQLVPVDSKAGISLTVDPNVLLEVLNQEKEEAYRFLDGVANDAERLAAIWNELHRELAETLVENDLETLERILEKHDLSPLANVPHFFRLQGFYRAVEQASEQGRSIGFAQLTMNLLELLDSRGQLGVELDLLVADVFSGERTVVDTETLRQKILGMKDLVEALHREAAAIRVLAERTRYLPDGTK